MHIKTITSRSRRDFWAIYECGKCGHAYRDSGYDDAYFHNTAIPAMTCPSCGEVEGSDYEPAVPKNPEGYII